MRLSGRLAGALRPMGGSLRLRGAMVLLLAMSAGPLSAEPEAYRLGPGDEIALTILQRGEANGTYVVQDDGAVSLPGVGLVSAEGLTLRDFEAVVTSKAAETVRDPSVAIQIVQRRPFYIAGAVSQPGGYPHRAKLTVMQAVALAGGFGRRLESGDPLNEMVIGTRAEQAHADAALQRGALLIRAARLNAELAGDHDFDITASEAGLSDAAAAPLLEKERQLLSTRLGQKERQIEILRSNSAARQEEMAAHDARIAQQTSMLDELSGELAKLREARDRGMVTSERVNDIMREEDNTRGNQMQSNILRNQSRVAVIELEERMVDIEAGFRESLLTELRDTETQLRSLSNSLRAEGALMEATGSNTLSNSETIGQYDFSIIRDDAPVIGPIGLTTRVEPGDVLMVARRSVSQ